MKINVHALKDGLHSFDFDKAGLELELDPRSFQSKIHIASHIEKKDYDIFVRTQVEAIVHHVCDNCLEEFSREIEGEFRLMYTPNRDYLLEDEDSVRFLPRHQQELDLAEGVREALLLAVPMRMVCTARCKGLCPECGANLNMKICGCRAKQVARGWEGLKELTNPA